MDQHLDQGRARDPTPDRAWTSWCRLCAINPGAGPDTPHNIAGDVQHETFSLATKYLTLDKDYPDLPRFVCQECSFILSRFDRYADRCEKVQLMFLTLLSDADGFKDKNSCETFRDGFLNSMEMDENKLFPICTLKSEEDVNENNKEKGIFRQENSTKPIKIEFVDNDNDAYDQYSDDDYLPLVDVPGNSKENKKKLSKKDKKDKLKKKKTKKKEKSEDVFNDMNIKLEPLSDEENIPDEELENENITSVVKKEIKPRKTAESYLKYECYICNEDCGNWHALCIHFRDTHNSRAKIMCCCGKYLASRVSIGRHWARHGKADSHNCPSCNKRFPRASELKTHMITHLPREDYPFVCCKCARRFTTPQLLRHHEKKHIPMEERLVHLCELCKTKFASKSSLIMHMKAVHERLKPFVCDQCGKAFTTKGILEEHQVRHSDARPHVCSVCHKSFKTKQRLAIHSDTHNGTVYQCPHCPIQLNSRRTLRMHLFVHDNVCRYQCSFCDKGFKRAKDLKNHSNLHTGMRPYACPWCTRTFANGSNCRAHKRRMHPNELRISDAKAAMVNRVINPENADGEGAINMNEEKGPSKIIYTPVKQNFGPESPDDSEHMDFPPDISEDYKPSLHNEGESSNGKKSEKTSSPKTKKETSSPSHVSEMSVSPLNLNAATKFVDIQTCGRSISIIPLQTDNKPYNFQNISENYQIANAIHEAKNIDSNFGTDEYKVQPSERVFNKASQLFANFTGNQSLNSYSSSAPATNVSSFPYNLQFTRNNDD